VTLCQLDVSNGDALSCTTALSYTFTETEVYTEAYTLLAN